jgi:CDP-diacylglycerol--glycerol-3-phosphate 3-phosphatidyltransferase
MLENSRSFHWKFYFVMGLTLVRVPLIFLFLCVSVFGGHPLPAPWFIVAFSATILWALTDLFDGYFARRFKVTSRLGSYADPMMDKVFYVATFPTLVYLAEQLSQSTHACTLLILAIVVYTSYFWPALRLELRPPVAKSTETK